MTTRAGRPDMPADLTLRSLLDQSPPASFVMVAGAGSGKTTSLVKALEYVGRTRGSELKRRGQKVACITYTEIAEQEILADVGRSPIFHVSTIHSFLWPIIKPFRDDIRSWIAERLQEKIVDRRTTIEKKGTRAATKTRLEADILRYEADKIALERVARFTYGTGSNYKTGVLGHSDIIAMVPILLVKYDLLKTVMAQRFPFVFVDESQDTVPGFVDALKAVEVHMRGQFCVGFFGDQMQQIYPTGVGAIKVEAGWSEITKPENFRCPAPVLAVINRIRAAADGLIQVPGRRQGQETDAVNGSAQIFVLPADDRRGAWLSAVRDRLASESGDIEWREGGDTANTRILVLVHRMAAKRLGFAELYAAMNDKAPSSLKDGFLDGSSWAVRALLSYVLPLAAAVQDGREFEVMRLLRNNCPLLEDDALAGIDLAARLRQLQIDVARLATLAGRSSLAPVRQVLEFVSDHHIGRLDERLLGHLMRDPDAVQEEADATDEDTLIERGSMDRFFACPAEQLWGYQTYIENESPFSTHQGIKGAEFTRVLVVLDDEEGSGMTSFSYNKYFGIDTLSATDQENLRKGDETVVDRTRRLFYVCCSRALRDLAVVVFAQDPQSAGDAIRHLGLFPDEQVQVVSELGMITS